MGRLFGRLGVGRGVWMGGVGRVIFVRGLLFEMFGRLKFEL